MKRRIIAVFLMSAGGGVFVLPAAGRADPVEQVHQLLNRIDRAWAEHDHELLRTALCDEGMMVIAAPIDRPEGAWVANKESLLSAVATLWEQNPEWSRRIAGREIHVARDVAWMRLTVVDRTPGRPDRISCMRAFALRRGETWQMCFSMPLLARPVLLVTAVEPGSQATRVGIRSGDIVVSYAGQRIETVRQLTESQASATPEESVRLVVRRGAEQFRFDVTSGALGLDCEDRLLPVDTAVLVGADQPHAIKEIMQEELDAAKAGDVERLWRLFCPNGFFSLAPEESGPTRVLTLDNIREVLDGSLRQLGAALDLSTARYADMRVIVDGDVALASNYFVVKTRGDDGGLLTRPSVLEVYVRQKGKWWLASMLPWRVEIGLHLHGQHYSREETKLREDLRRGQMVGLGISIEAKPAGIRIKEVFADSGAARAGLEEGEIITVIEGKSTAGMSTRDAVRLLGGPEGSFITIEVGPPAGRTRHITVERTAYVIFSVDHRMLTNQIGYIRIRSFSEGTGAEVRDATNNLLGQGMAGLVLDLRKSGGGRLSEMVTVIDLFIPPGRTMFLSQVSGDRPKAIKSKAKQSTDVPIVVLVDAESGGELVAAALKRTKRATLVGCKTPGLTANKQLVEHPDGSSEVVVVGQYLISRRRPLTGRGVAPHVRIPPDAEPQEALDKAIELLAAKVKKE